jgi:hypothetical protein
MGLAVQGCVRACIAPAGRAELLREEQVQEDIDPIRRREHAKPTLDLGPNSEAQPRACELDPERIEARRRELRSGGRRLRSGAIRDRDPSFARRLDARLGVLRAV